MSGQRVVLVLSFDLDGSDPEALGQQVADVVRDIDPPRLAGFTGELRVSVEPVSRQVERWLDDGDLPPTDGPPQRVAGRMAKPNTFGKQQPRNRHERRHGFR